MNAHKRRPLGAGEGIDKATLWSALGVVGAGGAFLVAMLLLLFPEWVGFHSFAAEPTTPAVQLVTLRPSMVLSNAVTIQPTPVERTQLRMPVEARTQVSVLGASPIFVPLVNAAGGSFNTTTHGVRFDALLQDNPLVEPSLAITGLSVDVALSIGVPGTPLTPPVSVSATVTVNPTSGIDARTQIDSRATPGVLNQVDNKAVADTGSQVETAANDVKDAADKAAAGITELGVKRP